MTWKRWADTIAGFYIWNLLKKCEHSMSTPLGKRISNLYLYAPQTLSQWICCGSQQIKKRYIGIGCMLYKNYHKDILPLHAFAFLFLCKVVRGRVLFFFLERDRFFWHGLTSHNSWIGSCIKHVFWLYMDVYVYKSAYVGVVFTYVSPCQ